MPFYKGNKKIENVFITSAQQKEIYKGNQLVYSSKLPAGQTIFENATAGTYTVTLQKTQNYRLIMVGGGGGGANGGSGHYTNYNVGGGSGGYIEVIVRLTKGSYSVAVGVSVYGTYGQGQNAYGGNGVAGYIKIITA